jgi:hypothetical protein
LRPVTDRLHGGAIAVLLYILLRAAGPTLALVAAAFFGVHMILLGILLTRSDRFPWTLGVLLGVAGLAYAAESFTFRLSSGARCSRQAACEEQPTCTHSTEDCWRENRRGRHSIVVN